MRIVRCPQCKRKTDKLEIFGYCEHCGQRALTAGSAEYLKNAGAGKLRSTATVVFLYLAALVQFGAGVYIWHILMAGAPRGGVLGDLIASMAWRSFVGRTVIAAFFGVMGTLALYRPFPAALVSFLCYGLCMGTIFGVALSRGEKAAVYELISESLTTCTVLIALFCSLLTRLR
jgi:hypothetical protein